MKVLIIKRDLGSRLEGNINYEIDETWLVSNEYHSDLLPKLWENYKKSDEKDKFYQFMEKQGFQLVNFDEVVL